MSKLHQYQLKGLQLTTAKRIAMSGVAAVEFALLLPIMILLVFGISEYGRALYQYNTLVKTVRDSARFLTQYNPADGAYPLAEAKCLVIYGNTTCSGSKLVPGLTVTMVKVCNPVACPIDYTIIVPNAGTINLVEVKITGFQFQSLVPFVTNNSKLLNFGDIKTTMRQVL